MMLRTLLLFATLVEGTPKYFSKRLMRSSRAASTSNLEFSVMLLIEVPDDSAMPVASELNFICSKFVLIFVDKSF